MTAIEHTLSELPVNTCIRSISIQIVHLSNHGSGWSSRSLNIFLAVQNSKFTVFFTEKRNIQITCFKQTKRFWAFLASRTKNTVIIRQMTTLQIWEQILFQTLTSFFASPSLVLSHQFLGSYSITASFPLPRYWITSIHGTLVSSK